MRLQYNSSVVAPRGGVDIQTKLAFLSRLRRTCKELRGCLEQSPEPPTANFQLLLSPACGTHDTRPHPETDAPDE